MKQSGSLERIRSKVRQINQLLYSTKNEYMQALLLTQLGEYQLKLGELDDARISLMIAFEHFSHKLYKTELKKVESLLQSINNLYPKSI